MAVRRNDMLDLTVAMPLLCREIASEKDYFDRKEMLLREMGIFVQRFEGFKKISVRYNSLDEPRRGMDGIYLSLLGTSAEDADSGQVGRGNRVNGLISVNRPMGTEAAAGKNPVSHVGKIYNLLAHRIAQNLYQEIEGLQEVYVFLVSRIGAPIDRPNTAAVQAVLKPGQNISGISGKTEEIFAREFSGIEEFCRDLSEGKYPPC